MKKSRETTALPVIDLREGKALGRVHNLVFNPSERRITALEVGERSLLKTKTELVPFSRIRSIGSDAVMVEDFEALPEEQEKELSALADRKLIGSRVVTVEGTLVGTVEDFAFMADNGSLVELAVAVEKNKGHLLLPVDTVESFGRDFIIVTADYQARATEAPPQHERPGRQFVQSLEARAIEFAMGREAGHDVFGENEEIVIRKGEKVTGEIIASAREKNRLAHVLLAAGVGELLEGIDFTREKLDSGSKKLLDVWHSLRHRSQEWLARRVDDDRPGPTSELRELWFQLQGKISQGGRELEETTREKIKRYVEGKTLAHPVYDGEGELIAGKGETVTAAVLSRAESAGRLPQLFLSAAAADVRMALDPIKQQIKDLLNEWDKKDK